jgi:hypothetical protein
MRAAPRINRRFHPGQPTTHSFHTFHCFHPQNRPVMEKMTASLPGADIAFARQTPTSRRTSGQANDAPIFHQNRVSNHPKQAKQWKIQQPPTRDPGGRPLQRRL